MCHSDLCGQNRQVPGAMGQSPLGCCCSHSEGQGVPPTLSPDEGTHTRPHATRGLLPPPQAMEDQGGCTPGLGEKSSQDPNPKAYGPLSLTIVFVQRCPRNLLVSAPGHPAPNWCQRLQILVFSKVLSVNFLHASVPGHSSLFLQKPLDVGLDGVENVMCKYWFGLIFSILISNW